MTLVLTAQTAGEPPEPELGQAEAARDHRPRDILDRGNRPPLGVEVRTDDANIESAPVQERASLARACFFSEGENESCTHGPASPLGEAFSPGA